MPTPEAIRTQILALVKEYHTAKFAPKTFDPEKDMVHYAGRVFDARTDSGGMQKEAYWLKVPCITLRDETEWNILTGADRDRIVETVRTFKAPSEHPPLYGDGNAAAH